MSIEERPQSPGRPVHSETKRGLFKSSGALGFAIASLLFAEQAIDSPVVAQEKTAAQSGHELALSADQLPAHLRQAPPVATLGPSQNESGQTFSSYLPNVVNQADVHGSTPVVGSTPTASQERPTSTSTVEPPSPTATVEPLPTPELLRGELPQGLQVHVAPGSQANHNELSSPSPDSAYIGSYKQQNFTGVAAEFPQDFTYDLFRLQDGTIVSVKTNKVPWVSPENRYETTEEVWVENKAYEGESKFVTNKSEDIFASGIRYVGMPTRFEIAYEKIEGERHLSATKKAEFDENLGATEQLNAHGVAVNIVQWSAGEKATAELFSITTSATGVTKINYDGHDWTLFDAGVAPGKLVADVNWNGTEITVSQRQSDDTMLPIKTVTLSTPIVDNKTFLVGHTISQGEFIQANYAAFEKPDGVYNPKDTLSTSGTLEDLAAEKGMQMGVTAFWGTNYFSESRTIASESHPQVDHFYMSAAVVDSPTASGMPNINVINYYKDHGFEPEYGFWLWSQQNATNGTKEQLHTQLDNLLTGVDTNKPGRFITALSRSFIDVSHAYSNLFPDSSIAGEINSYISTKAPNLEIWHRVPGSLMLVGPDMQTFTQDIQRLGQNKPDGIQLSPSIGIGGSVPEDKIDEFVQNSRTLLQNGIKVDWVNVAFSNRNGGDTSKLAKELISEAHTLSQEYPDQFSFYNGNNDQNAQPGVHEYAYQLDVDYPGPERSHLYWDMYDTFELLP